MKKSFKYNPFSGVLETKKSVMLNPTLYYEIIEKVIDNRGTSTRSYTEAIFISEKQKSTNFDELLELKFSYPKSWEYILVVLAMLLFFWQMNLGERFMRINLNYKCVFQVEKQYLN